MMLVMAISKKVRRGMTFKKHIEKILQTEISSIIKQQGYVLETEFCNMVSEKYNVSLPTVRGQLGIIYPEMSLIKRRLSDDLKRFYGLEVKGYPIVYLLDE